MILVRRGDSSGARDALAPADPQGCLRARGDFHGPDRVAPRRCGGRGPGTRPGAAATTPEDEIDIELVAPSAAVTTPPRELRDRDGSPLDGWELAARLTAGRLNHADVVVVTARSARWAPTSRGWVAARWSR
jgi:hypothetical protein